MTERTTPPARGRGLGAFLRFGALSGGGWLLDLGLLLLLVGRFGVPPAGANVASSSCAALTVFLVSRRLLFASPPGALGRRVLAYFCYTLLVILAASLLLQGLVAMLAASSWGAGQTATVLATAAKVLVTPPQLLLNFFASRFLSERRLP